MYVLYMYMSVCVCVRKAQACAYQLLRAFPYHYTVISPPRISDFAPSADSQGTRYVSVYLIC